MITAIVTIKIPEGINRDEAKARFQETAPKYQGVPGLVRKYYLFDPAGTVGGVYLWESQADAESFYNDEWRAMIVDKYGVSPETSFFETPVIVDNPSKEIIIEAVA